MERAYNDFSQMVEESQAHGGAVASGTPKVAYAYADGSANHTRMTSMSYPTTRQTSFDYGSSGGMDDSLSRVASLKDGATVMAGYTYVGVDQVVRIDHDEPGVKLTYIAQGSEPVGDGGDIYTGWDRFGRVIDVRWLQSATALERLKYGFDRAGNRLWRKNEVQTTGQDEHYTYDGLYQLKELDRGTLDSGKTKIDGTPG